MIAYLKGTIIKKTDKGIILLNKEDIGYLIHLAKSALAEIQENSQTALFIHQNIKEDASDLYGFSSYEDLEFFKQFLNINGIGPKVALEILNFPREKIASAILNNDESYICEIPGIGQKLAKRIILELKDKIRKSGFEEREYKSITNQAQKEAVDALLKLGYQRKEITKIISELPRDISKTEQIITYFLQHI